MPRPARIKSNKPGMCPEYEPLSKAEIRADAAAKRAARRKRDPKLAGTAEPR